jgi:hypothetical protein
MKTILGVLGIVVALILAVAIGAVVVVLSATGLGILLVRFLPLSIFEASLLTLISLLALFYAGWRVAAAFVSSPLSLPLDDDEDDEWDEEADEENDDDEPLDERDFVPSIPRWRQPIKRAEYGKVGRNDPCPCGSGKKYKYCHGKAN